MAFSEPAFSDAIKKTWIDQGMQSTLKSIDKKTFFNLMISGILAKYHDSELPLI